MEDEVIEKLRVELSQAIKSERQVVYMMSLIRKLFEHRKIKRYCLLSLYCDWVLHIKLDRAGAKKILESFSGTRRRSNQLKVFTFEGLRKEMESFLVKFNLPIEVVNKGWFQFRRNLLSTIIDCPLSYPTTSIKEFSFIRTSDRFKDFTGKYFITYRIIPQKGKPDETSVMLADQDDETKAEMKEKEEWFNRRYRLKVYGKLMNHAKTLTGDERRKVEEEAEKIAAELEAKPETGVQ